MIHHLTSYLSFLLRSGNAHGLHSPFVYKLYTQCIRDRNPYPEYQQLKEYRKALYADHRTIQVRDLGAGSRVFKGPDRNIAGIARKVGASSREQKLLFRLARYFRPLEILELGTSLGLGTIALALGSPAAKVVSVEGCPETASVATEYLTNSDLNHLQVVNQDFGSYLEKRKAPFDLVYLDGHHSRVATLDLFEQLLPLTHNDSLLILDDIYWSKEMERAWKNLIARPEVRVSIDLYHMGLLFFRREQPKQHFALRM